jgi:NAD(P)H-nitrite reductase large subunit
MADCMIIGNGAAGRKAAEKIRSRNSDCSVVMYTDEPFPFYPRPRLSLGYISGEMTRDAMFAAPEFYSKNKVSLIFSSISSVLPEKNSVVLSDGLEVSYKVLLIASGASAVVPPWEGGKLDGVVTLRTMSDADNIIKRLESVDYAVVAGGGILGCEVAEAINKRGKKVALLVRGGKEQVGAPALVPEKASARCDSMISNGIDVMIEEEVGKLNGKEKLEEVVTASGKTIKTGLVVCTIGARANIGFLNNSSVKTGRGVIVNAELAALDFPNVFAAGDAAEVTGEGCEKQRYGSPYINAMKQGEYAAEKMLELLR